MNTFHPAVGTVHDGKTVLVSGGTGRFGHAVVERILRTDVHEVRVFSRNHIKQEQMRRRLGDDRVRYLVGDVRDDTTVRSALRGVDHVFHAATLQQVPGCETSPDQAVDTNVRGTHTLLTEAKAAGVARVVCLTSDQGVYPVNAMGMTKALMEKLARARPEHAEASPTVVSCVRHGDVLYSTGSDLPRLVEQLRTGTSPTLTDPGMTTFLMSMRECVDLVERAFHHGAHGDVFIHKTPATRLGDLVSVLCDLFGSLPVYQIAGQRPGEKTHATLATREELAFAENCGDHLRLRPAGTPLHCDLLLDEGEGDLNRWTDYRSDRVTRITRQELGATLLEIPELRTALHTAGRDLNALADKYGVNLTHLAPTPNHHREATLELA